MSRIAIEIDGNTVPADAGRDLLSTCLGSGIDVPHFCWHDALGSVGACRLCAIRLFDGPDDRTGRIAMACMTAAADGQRILTLDPAAADLRARVIEWLMINHPHDCAVCEEAGACHLQDMTVATGHRTRRYRFDKRTHRNQYLGPLLTHEMNRCIACYRCTRFYRGYAGGRDLDVFGAHDSVYFGRSEDGVLESPFAGNLAEICPTGVFNDKGWSGDYARKWDMPATPAICSLCSVGCNIFVAERDNRVRRVQNRYHGGINGHFLCDRGRFGALHVAAAGGIVQAEIACAPAPGGTAMEAARLALGGGAMGIGSPRASLETNFALRSLVGAENFHAGTSDHEAAMVARMAALLMQGPARVASLSDIQSADAAIVLGEDLTGTAPRAALALRQTARAASLALAAEKGVPPWLDNAARVAGEGRRSPVILVTSLPDALDDVASLALRRAPSDIGAFGQQVAAAIRGEAVDDSEAVAVAQALTGAQAPAVIAGSGAGRADAIEAAGAIAQALGARARLALFPPEVNSLGLAMMAGSGIERCLQTLESGAPRAVVIAENDLFERVDAGLVARLFAAASSVIVLDSLPSRTTGRADILLPVGNWAQTTGTFINHSGLAQRSFAATASALQPAWRVLAALSPTALWDGPDALLQEMGAAFPLLAGAGAAAPGAAFRTPVGRIARAPWRMSGRTADDRAGRLHEAVPPVDQNAPLTFSMEGAHGAAAPAALLTGYETPGLHSASASWRFIDMDRHELKGGDPGVPLLLAAGSAPGRPLDQHEAQGDGLIALVLHDPFIGNECARAAPRLMQRAPAPVAAINPADATMLGLAAGDRILIDGRPCPALLSTADHIPHGHLGMSAGTVAPRGLARRVRVARAS